MIPADTDFRMFSHDYLGSLPGIDVATVLDATAYHTNRDTFERVRSGTTQVSCPLFQGEVKGRSVTSFCFSSSFIRNAIRKRD